MSHLWPWSRSALVLVLMFGGAAAPAATGQGSVPASDFQYHAQPRDTLIGLGRRLLLEPRRWRELQSRNRIIDPRRIPSGAVIQIPYEWLRTASESASVGNLSGVVRQAGNQVAQGDALPEGSVIETGRDGSVTLDLADGSVVTLQKSSTLRLEQMTRVMGVAAAHSIRLKLQSGRAETTVKPHRDVGRFEIITPVAVSAVRGTRFRNSFDSDGDRAGTETLDGAVGVAGDGGVVAVPAGFGTRVDRGKPPLPPVSLLPPPDLADLPQINTGALLRVPLRAVPGANAYRVQLARDKQFRAITVDALVLEAVASLPDVPDGDYWLRARSIDGLGLEGPDAVRQIAQRRLPDPPQLLAPINAEKITGAHVHLAWAGVGAQARYALQVAHDAAFAAPVVDRPSLDTAAAEVEDLPPGQYFWRVAALNARNEAGPWSVVQTYTQRQAMTMPDAPRLLGKMLDFSWQAIPGQGYRAQVARDVDFQHVVLDHRLDQSHWSVPPPFPGTYYLRVQAVDADGSLGEFGPPRRFQSPIPLWVKIATPVALVLTLLL